MQQLIKDSTIVLDEWALLSEDDAKQTWPDGKLIVPAAVWQAQAADLGNRVVGVWVEGDVELKDYCDDSSNSITRLPLIAVRFPAFMDGRGFTTGRLLRERYHFTGELRAVGHFIRDQLCYLRRCGFSSFKFSHDENLESALLSLNDFQEYYQAAVDEPQPLFRRRRS